MPATSSFCHSVVQTTFLPYLPNSSSSLILSVPVIYPALCLLHVSTEVVLSSPNALCFCVSSLVYSLSYKTYYSASPSRKFPLCPHSTLSYSNFICEAVWPYLCNIFLFPKTESCWDSALSIYALQYNSFKKKFLLTSHVVLTRFTTVKNGYLFSWHFCSGGRQAINSCSNR